jgi:hypothetical protein
VLFPISVAVPFAAQFVNRSTPATGVTGLTVSVTVTRIEANGTKTTMVATTTTGVVEVANGVYHYWLAAASTATAGAYYCVFSTADSTVAAQQIPALEIVGAAWVQTAAGAMQAASYTAAPPTAQIVSAMQADATSLDTLLDRLTEVRAAKLDAIGALSVTVLSPLATDHTLTLVQGDSYRAAEGRSITFTETTGAWLFAVGKTATLTGRSINSTLSKAVTITNPTGTIVVATVADVLSAATALLDVWDHGQYDVQVAIAPGTADVTLVTGRFIVSGGITPPSTA